MPKVFSGPAAVKEAVGTHLGYTDWMVIDQDRINRFADATGDHQWIHVDTERAKEGPFGATIAHGYLTLSLTNLFLPQLLTVENISMGINYGVNKVRFPAPVRVGSRIRAGAEIVDAEDIPGGVQAIIKITVELEGSEKPACVVENVTRYMA
ncbi:MAG TPA: MaoC family dehydratase [Acidimicrobiales bacterium]